MYILLKFLLGCVASAWGLALGLVAGYFVFLYKLPRNPPVPNLKSLKEHSGQELQDMMTQIPLWLKQPDWSRVLWLNRFIVKAWPYYNEAISKTVRAAVEPLIKQYKPAQVTSIEIETLDMGTCPPFIDSAKSLETVDHEMIIQAQLRWASNANIRLRVKAFGLSVTLQLSELVVYGTARATFKPLVYVFPCFSGIVVSLLGKPTVDCSLKLYNLDLMALPGVYHYVQHIVKKIVAELMMFPRSLQVYSLDVASSSRKPVGMLHVQLIAAKDLKKTDLLGKSDPWVEMWVGLSRKVKSTTKPSTLNPEWDESFSFLVEDPSQEILTLQIYDADVTKSQKNGICQLALSELVPNEPLDKWLEVKKDLDPLNPKNQRYRGLLHIEATYRSFKGEDDDPIEVPGVPGGLESEAERAEAEAASKAPAGGGLLLVVVDKCSDLASKHGPSVNAYVKVRLRNEKRKTKLVKRNSDPEWNETFRFILEEPPVEEVLHVEVWHRSMGLTKLLSRVTLDTVHSVKERVGDVDIPLGDVVRNARTNDIYQLNNTRKGSITVELQWLSQ